MAPKVSMVFPSVIFGAHLSDIFGVMSKVMREVAVITSWAIGRSYDVGFIRHRDLLFIAIAVSRFMS